MPADPIHLDFVLGNVMVGTVNANREYVEMSVRDVSCLENYATLFEHLGNGKGAITMHCEVADL